VDSNIAGIVVEDAVLSASGVVANPFTVSNNSTVGFSIYAPVASISSTLSEIDQVTASGNQAGMFLFAQTQITVTNSTFTGNTAAQIEIGDGTIPNPTGINLGHAPAFGFNKIGQEGNVPGICVLAGSAGGTAVFAEGNTFGTHDCSAGSPGYMVVVDNKGCTLAYPADVSLAMPGTTVSVANCTQ
jgi:hypothetical protein